VEDDPNQGGGGSQSGNGGSSDGDEPRTTSTATPAPTSTSTPPTELVIDATAAGESTVNYYERVLWHESGTLVLEDGAGFGLEVTQ